MLPYEIYSQLSFTYDYAGDIFSMYYIHVTI